MKSRGVFAPAVFAAALALAPALASAQQAGRVVLTPWVGAYRPSTHFSRVGASSLGGFVATDLKHQSSIAYGATGSYWFTDRVAVEVGGAYTESGSRGVLVIVDPNGIAALSGTDNAHVWLGDVKALFQLLPSDSPFNLRFGIGPAVVSRGGTAYKPGEQGKMVGLTDFGGAFSLCTRIHITKGVGVRVRVEDFLYQSKIGYSSNDVTGESWRLNGRAQNDLVLSMGLQVAVR